MAYDQLTPEMKKKVDELSTVLGNYFPTMASFVSSASWADEIKTQGVKAFNNWHFINQRFSYIRIRMPDTKQRENVVWAVGQGQEVLQAEKTNSFEKSVFLRFLVHFAGDAHQPTQCSNFYSWQFPEGDNGGTTFLIRSNIANNIHQFWDNGLGALMVNHEGPPTGEEIRQYATAIEQKYPVSFFGPDVEQLDPAVWAKESLRIAETFAYKEIKPGAEPSETYITQGQDDVNQRLALTGYRLANLLNWIFAEKGNASDQMERNG